MFQDLKELRPGINVLGNGVYQTFTTAFGLSIEQKVIFTHNPNSNRFV